ncbi:MAG TPA: VWA domain-containing protein [Candidatus Acidoferrum sp.]|nr:VWA domain-containing protein [Candidatus Acidoferrum sp.]
MSVEHPWWLLAAVLFAGVFGVALMRIQRRVTARDLAYSNIEFFAQTVRPRTWIPRALAIAWIAGVLGVVGAAARPHVDVPLPTHDGQVFICIDTSGSMASADVLPTRAIAAKSAAQAFINATPSGTKIGIIAFSADASLVQPLSSDRAAVVASLDNVPQPDGATAIGDALKLAAQNLPNAGHRVIVLITDGVNNAGSDPLEIAQFLGQHGVPVYTVGIGTAQGGIIPGTNDEATIDEDALRQYAELSGGAYARAENAVQLRDALSRLARVTTVQRREIDASLPLALSGSALMVAAFLCGMATGRYP